ncbi:hypothetical protein HLH34_08845 [Gluconacetobacter azotocaptans]|uniref:Uncharacterized protein n=1 Tax=Gluconacetobacter azotocaptans TaxID=142834 RepID=A0A7W4JSJ1_9PROT|nr:YidB family protein [Gluconacetobacter azotocaptans]MBB2190075.1 hypothetical protein [Gluconacetobacter azotocaptans]MBM9402801.1 hypothetical protein [Gluconacetobacter azotocaptans]GBQ26084.1 hypothetical protein AA13594_0128 [Gluconacetobacter azotocaptans DSM 13594]
MMTTPPRFGPKGGKPAPGPWRAETTLDAWLDAFLSDTAPERGYVFLMRQAADTGLYDVVRRWSQTGNPEPTDAATVLSLMPPDMLAEISRKTALQRDEVVTRLSEELPVAVRQHTLGKRFNRFGHAGCVGEDPTRR